MNYTETIEKPLVDYINEALENSNVQVPDYLFPFNQPVPPSAIDIPKGDLSQLEQIRDLYTVYLITKTSLEAKAQVWFYQDPEVYVEILEQIAQITSIMKHIDGIRTKIVFPKLDINETSNQ